MNRRPSPAHRRHGAAPALLLAAAVGLLAVVPFVGTAGADPTPPPGASLHLSTTVLPAGGGTVTVRGSGYDPAASVGTRPPFAGQPAGVYVVFGRFADVWQPSLRAPATSRQVISQVWALPRAQHDLLDPFGTNPEVVLLEADGSFTAEVPVRPVEGAGRYALATYPGSGGLNAALERLVPVTLTDDPLPTTTTSTVPTPPTTVTTTTVPTPPTTVPSTTVPSTTVPSTTVPPPTGGPASATGPRGQVLTASPATGLDRSGADVEVRGSRYDPTVGIYVALCVDQGPGAAPSPCLGGATLEGTTGTSAWVASDPPDYAAGLATPFGDGGTFTVRLRLAASDRFVDCLAPGTTCVLATRADHTAPADRSADVRLPVRFAGQDPVVAPVTPVVTASVEPGTVPAGGRVQVRATGLRGGEQVQVRLVATGAVLAAGTAGPDGSAIVPVVVPAGTATGVHRLSVTGVTSGRTATTDELTVTEPPAVGAPAAAATGATVRGATAVPGAAAAPVAVPPARLALTGGGVGGVAAGAVLLATGLAVLVLHRRLAGRGAR